MKIGYFWWGFMADVRMKNGQAFSSPDGSLLHAFSIIRGFQQAGHEVYRLAPDRDAEFYKLKGANAFTEFSFNERLKAYSSIKPCEHEITKNEIIYKWPDVNAVILEWRMPTRYNTLPMDHIDFEPDLIIQREIIEYYTYKQIPIIVLDFDYKLDRSNDKQFMCVLEPGFSRGRENHIHVPFLMDEIEQFPMLPPRNKIVYVGNRYERDGEFDKFFGVGSDIEYEVWGNWLEYEKDSKERWPHVKFKGRAQPYQIHEALSLSILTPMIGRKEYYDYSFTSIRFIESLLFGTIPVLPSSYDNAVMNFPYQLFVENEKQMLHLAKLKSFQKQSNREKIRKSLIERFHEHDVSYFVKKIENMLGE